MELTTKFKLNSERKLDVEFVDEYKPLKDHDEVIVKLKHLDSAEIGKYIDRNTMEFNFPKMFKSKVISVEGISLKDEDGNVIEVTPDVILTIACPIFDKIVYATCGYIVQYYNLTKEEEKNLNGDYKH